MARYYEVPASEVPGNLIWIIPARHAGQIVEVSYSTGAPSGRTVNYDADEGDPYKQVLDRSAPRPRYYRLAR